MIKLILLYVSNNNKTGGLIQIATYGNKDLFLTGNPEITFFKTIYKRYTNFSIESKKLPFNNDINFDQLCSINVPKNADLLHKMYLEIQLPEINILNIKSQNISDNDLKLSKLNYDICVNFMRVNVEAYRNAYKEFLPGNIINAEELINQIKLTFDNELYNRPIDTEKYQNSSEEFLQMLIEYYNDSTTANKIFSNISILKSIQKYSDENTKYEVMNNLEIVLRKSIHLEEELFKKYNEKKDEFNFNSKENIKFAWINNIGTSLIEYIEVEIGGKIIDKHYGEWLNIWNELTLSEYQEENYKKMNGNVSELTSFDKNIKPSYLLEIPLNFWFNRHNGLAFPLVALQYQELNINVKFRKISECSYYENDSIIDINNNGNNYNLDELVSEDIIKLSGNLSVDYIFLDKNERKLFSNSQHEYLIEQVQFEYFNNIFNNNINVKLEFLHSCKEFIWIFKKINILKRIMKIHINYNGIIILLVIIILEIHF